LVNPRSSGEWCIFFPALVAATTLPWNPILWQTAMRARRRPEHSVGPPVTGCYTASPSVNAMRRSARDVVPKCITAMLPTSTYAMDVE
jgi:hypothetical protein